MSIVLDIASGNSQKIAVSAASSQSAPISASVCTIYSDVDCYVRQGVNPVAVADGSDQFIPAGAFIRLTGIVKGNKLAVIANSAGAVHLTPGA